MPRPRYQPCPHCGSKQVQTVESAYRQSVRHGRDFSTISDLGAQLSPPERKDAVVLPWLIGGIVYVVVMFLMLIVLDTPLPLAPWELIEQGYGMHFALAFGLALAVALGMSIPARRYNELRLPTLMEAWECDWICRSCLHRYQPSKSDGGQ